MIARYRKHLLVWHRWLGVHLGLLLFLLCATGTLAVVGHELNWLLDPAFRSPAAKMRWDRVDESLQAQFADHQIYSVSLPAAPGHAATAMLLSPNGQIQYALFDPGTGKLQATRHLITAQFYLRQLHKSLLMPNGLYVLGGLGLVLAFAALSGLLVVSNWWVQLKRCRLRGRPTVRWSDIHRTCGGWLALFALLVAATSSWYWFEWIAHNHLDWTTHEPKVHLKPPAKTKQSESSLMPLSRYAQAAERAFPGFHSTRISLPQHSGDAVRVDGRVGTQLVRDYGNQVSLDPYSANVIRVMRASSGPFVRLLADWADEVHFGTLGAFGGLWSKLLYVLLGTGLCVVTLAGPRLALLRQGGRAPTPGLKARSLGVRIASWTLLIVTTLFVTGVLVFTVLGQRYSQLAGRGAPTAVSAPLEYGTATLTVSEYRFGHRATYVALWSPVPPAALKQASVGPPGEKQPLKVMHGYKLAEATTLWSPEPAIELESHDTSIKQLRISWQSGPLVEKYPVLEPYLPAWFFVWGVVGAVLVLSAAVLRWFYWPLANH